MLHMRVRLVCKSKVNKVNLGNKELKSPEAFISKSVKPMYNKQFLRKVNLWSGGQPHICDHFYCLKEFSRWWSAICGCAREKLTAQAFFKCAQLSSLACCNPIN